MENSKIELIVKEWFELKTGTELSQETIKKILVDITEKEKDNISEKYVFLIQNKDDLLNVGCFSSLEKASASVKNNTIACRIIKTEVV
jgi:hypothetical protein